MVAESLDGNFLPLFNVKNRSPTVGDQHLFCLFRDNPVYTGEQQIKPWSGQHVDSPSSTGRSEC